MLTLLCSGSSLQDEGTLDAIILTMPLCPHSHALMFALFCRGPSLQDEGTL